MEYKIVYKGPRGGDLGRVNGMTLIYRNRTRSGVPQFPYALGFISAEDPNARYMIPNYQLDMSDVDEKYDFYQIYTGSMAAGHGPEAGVMPENRRAAAAAPAAAAAAPPAGPAAAGASGGRRRRLRKTRKTRRRVSRKSRTARR